MKITSLRLIVVFLVVFGLVACSGQSASKLVGKWTDGEDYIEFTETHLLLDGGVSVEYTIENDRIKMYPSGLTDGRIITRSYKFVDKDTFKFISDTSEETFKRVK